jgi:asparagine synthase (glutamine-hydrolysing)
MVGEFPSAEALSAVGEMVNSVRRRGPDAEGIEQWDRAVLGHRRLAIFDLSDAGRQPMLTPDRELGIVFNGAIYNFPELRTDLVARGCSFHSQTDTEVLLHGYREWGLEALVSRLRGMFAFGLWDNRLRALYLVRDRLGVKPLLYTRQEEYLAFASTSRALARAGFAERIDEQAVAEFLEFGFVTDQRVIYEDVKKVQAGSIVAWKDGRLTENTYWTPPREETAPELSFAEAVEQTEALLLQAVERRLQADVPVGALLSGGIDSGLVCWAIAKLGGDVTAFTVGTPGHPDDETADATATARLLGIRHRVVEAASEVPEVDELVSAYSEPLACPSALGMLRVSRAVADSAKVLLTGDGGDDVFLGYPRHRYLWTTEKLARFVPPAAARAWYRFRDDVPQTGLLRRATHFVDYTTGGLGAFIDAHQGLPLYRRHGFLGERLADARVEQRDVPWSIHSARYALSEFLAYERKTQFVAEYMTKVDGATMHYGIEARSPFLDQDLWEFAASLPFGVRLHHGRLKSILRALASKRVGERLARGSKRGFMIPVRRWIAGRWRESVAAMFRDSVLARDGWIRADPVLRCLADSAETGSAPLQLWYLLVLEAWMRSEQMGSTTREQLPIGGSLQRS